VLATTVRTLGSHGGLRKYTHDLVGMNSRLDGLQAVVLRAKLARLAGWNSLRRAAAARYDELLADLDVVRPVTLAGNEHVWHIYCIRVANRDEVLARLNAAGVGAAIHYPVPVHLTGAFAGLGYGPGSFPNAERTAPELLSLPIFPQITPIQQEAVIEALSAALN
jgi:dTDP-4-amino-4,6-dideoxygalactose transaminase